MSDDVHNPFSGNESEKRKREPGIFDPDYKGDRRDPFRRPDVADDDDKWDEPDEGGSTRDV